MIRGRTRAAACLASTLVLVGCQGLGGGPRPAGSSLACARTAVAAVITDDMPDKRKHCAGAGSIAALCSVTEARLASYGKELADAFDGGDPDVADLRADRAGIECARQDPDRARVLACCEARGY